MMAKIGLLALFLLSADAQLTPTNSRACDREGFAAGVSGVALDFLKSTLAYNNLGGYGPGVFDPKMLRYDNIGRDFTNNVVFDMSVVNISYYKPNKVIRNGYTFGGDFGQINLADDEECSFLYTFLERGTTNPLTLSEGFDFCLFDFDQGDAGRLSEKLSVCEIIGYSTVETDSGGAITHQLDIQQTSTGCYSFESNARGYGSDNPERPDQVLRPFASMTPFVKINVAPKYVCIKFGAGRSDFEATYTVSPSLDAGFSGRNFLFSGQVETSLGVVYAPCFVCNEEDPRGAFCQPCGGQTCLAIANDFAKLPEYGGPLSVSGTCGPIVTTGVTQTFSCELTGFDPRCSNGAGTSLYSCGIHMHSGQTCDAGAGPHFYVGIIDEDPWVNVAWDGDTKDGKAIFTASVTTGGNCRRVSSSNPNGMVGRTFIIHNYDGDRVACAPIEEVPEVPCTAAAKKPSCSESQALDCYPGSSSYPACLDSCAEECLKDCGNKHVCIDFNCYTCGEGPGSCEEFCGTDCAKNDPVAASTCEDDCIRTKCSPMCSGGKTYDSKEDCDKNCNSYACVHELEKCYLCSDMPAAAKNDICATEPTYPKYWPCQQTCKPHVARKDPHLYLPHGGEADFRGQHNVTFAFLSAKDFAFNIKIEEADFNWAKRLVHGTKMSAAFWVIRTASGKMVSIEFNASAQHNTYAIVHEKGHRDVTVRADAPPLSVDDVEVSFVGKTLTVTTPKWKTSATKAAFPFASLNQNKVLLDIEITPWYDADHDVVAPHGIFGQAYDGDKIGVNGKKDTDRSAEMTTKAQAEGAIEGTWEDYKLTSDFATAFKYSRFDAVAAKPRDVSKLTGEKKPISEATPMKAGVRDTE